MTDDGRITDARPYGYHVHLTCRNHPNKMWSTKNIAPIGCRNLFYNPNDVDDMGPECKCSISDLTLAE